jgi:hypothetical protein
MMARVWPQPSDGNRRLVDEFLSRSIDQLLNRSGGPLNVRFFFQPVVATIIAIRAGLRDAETGRAAYLWTLASQPLKRSILAREALKDVGRVFLLALSMDIVYQLLVFRWIYPGQALIVAFVLSIVPYILIRGPIARVVSRWKAH